MSTPSMPPAWYPDPSTPGQLRWWDGTQWTTNVAPQQGAGAGATAGAAAAFGAPAGATAGVGGPGGQRRPYAAFWQRAVALILDSIILFVPLFFIAVILGASLLAYGSGTFDAGALLMSLVFQAVGAVYFIYLIGEQGQTIGMRVMKIRVINAAGTNIGLETSFRRWLIPGGLSILSIIPVLGILASIASLINYLSMLWSDQNQCFHDQFAGTWVVVDD